MQIHTRLAVFSQTSDEYTHKSMSSYSNHVLFRFVDVVFSQILTNIDLGTVIQNEPRGKIDILDSDTFSAFIGMISTHACEYHQHFLEKGP